MCLFYCLGNKYAFVAYVDKPITSQRVARLETSRFHSQLTSNSSHTVGNKKAKEIGVDEEDDDNEEEGRARYQLASAIATSSSKLTAKFLFRTVTQLNLRPSRGQSPIPTLEVGAINTQLSSCPYLHVDAIDLNSRNPAIREVDFLTMAPDKQFRIVSLAMVLNCVSTEASRGKMLVLAREHLEDDCTALLFLALPLRFFKGPLLDKFTSKFMPKLGFELQLCEETPKIAMMAFRKVSRPIHEHGQQSSIHFKGSSGFDILVDVQ